MPNYAEQIIEACKRRGYDIFPYFSDAKERQKIAPLSSLKSCKHYALVPQATPTNRNPEKLKRGPFIQIGKERRMLVGFEPQLEDKPCAYVRIMFSSPDDLFPIRQFIKGLETLSEI